MTISISQLLINHNQIDRNGDFIGEKDEREQNRKMEEARVV